MTDDLYGGMPPFEKSSDTSFAAAASIPPSKLLADEGKVLRLITKENGMTCDEVEVSLEMKHQTASARIRGLVLKRYLKDSGARRLTRTGRKAAVWVRT